MEKQKPNHRLPEFIKLQTSITLALFKQQTEQPEYEALNSHTPLSDRFSRLSEYATDIVRIFRELELARSLAIKLPADSFFVEYESTREDYVMYHYGHFLDLIHQAKDKITRLTQGLTSPAPFKEPKKANPLTLASKEEIKRISGLPELLEVWTDEKDKKHSIAVALRRRTQYHHFRNRLHLNTDFLDIKLFRTMQQPEAQKMLSEEGKKLIEDKGNVGFEKWHADVAGRMENTIGDTQKNIESVAQILNESLGLPVLEDDAGIIFDSYFKMKESLDIKSVASLEHYNKTIFYPVIKSFEDLLPVTFGENLVSLYLVGSTTRGEAVIGKSDINFVMIMRDNVGFVLPVVQRLAEKIKEAIGVDVEWQVKTVMEFKNESEDLLRFICKTDGLLLKGVDSIGEESFPKPSLALTCLFKQKIKKDIDEVREHLSQDTVLSQDQVSALARRIAKAALRLMFSAVMADTAKYERSFVGMHKLVMEKYPENKYLTDIFFGLAEGSATVDIENLQNLMTGFDDDSSLGALVKQLDEKCCQLAESRNPTTSLGVL
jgi:hypothetical protein